MGMGEHSRFACCSRLGQLRTASETQPVPVYAPLHFHPPCCAPPAAFKLSSHRQQTWRSAKGGCAADAGGAPPATPAAVFLLSYVLKTAASFALIAACYLPRLPLLARYWLHALLLSISMGGIWDAYCAAAVGLCRLEVAASFDAPWLSSSFSDYWSRQGRGGWGQGGTLQVDRGPASRGTLRVAVPPALARPCVLWLGCHARLFFILQALEPDHQLHAKVEGRGETCVQGVPPARLPAGARSTQGAWHAPSVVTAHEAAAVGMVRTCHEKGLKRGPCMHPLTCTPTSPGPARGACTHKPARPQGACLRASAGGAPGAEGAFQRQPRQQQQARPHHSRGHSRRLRRRPSPAVPRRR
jgi:hypothetical protein